MGVESDNGGEQQGEPGRERAAPQIKATESLDAEFVDCDEA